MARLLGARLVQQPLVAGVALRRDRAARLRLLEGAALLVRAVLAVLVQARPRQPTQFDKALAQFVGGNIPQRQLADACRIGEPATLRQREESHAGRRVPTLMRRLADLADTLARSRNERVRERRLADTGGASQQRDFA